MHCDCCDKEFKRSVLFYAIRDGKRLLYLHKECVPVFSDGLGLKEIEEKLGVKIENEIEADTKGDVYWYEPGTLNLHRSGGPAAEWADGSKWWYIDGKVHREDGPAIEWADGNKYWYISGEEYTKEEHKAEMKKRRNKK